MLRGGPRLDQGVVKSTLMVDELCYRRSISLVDGSQTLCILQLQIPEWTAQSAHMEKRADWQFLVLVELLVESKS